MFTPSFRVHFLSSPLHLARTQDWTANQTKSLSLGATMPMGTRLYIQITLDFQIPSHHNHHNATSLSVGILFFPLYSDRMATEKPQACPSFPCPARRKRS